MGYSGNRGSFGKLSDEHRDNTDPRGNRSEGRGPQKRKIVEIECDDDDEAPEYAQLEDWTLRRSRGVSSNETRGSMSQSSTPSSNVFVGATFAFTKV